MKASIFVYFSGDPDECAKEILGKEGVVEITKLQREFEVPATSQGASTVVNPHCMVAVAEGRDNYSLLQLATRIRKEVTGVNVADPRIC